MRVQGATVPRRGLARGGDDRPLDRRAHPRVRPGLALPQAVAHAHGGDLSLRETQPGTVVSLRFPES